ncbi:alpha-2,8-polysialyltransferase family protein [Actinacidiphila glaucinigra]|uniref:polysialyltransferase family glycosyltransferase n=1 Tax=Actinacidiphila glaucinigra TaxID=235986 RepID=UPI002DDB37CE|nr:polysialyltransferase family glycosyltransferase [Actinacidiphila glaucinigra]WSD60489.1 alpha-2,8-polysialyltransferase family protein [Actinacidiphila glaucinigra]
MSRTQVFLASTLFGAATVAAALDAGLFAPADRRLLLVSNNAPVPEISPALDTAPGFGALRGRFDRVLSWNDTIAPLHPSGWSPRPEDVPLWERHLRRLWDLGEDEVELVVESLHVEPALALVNVFPGAPVEVYADGLMVYGPTRDRLDSLVTTRVDRVLHLDLVPGLRPLLLSEHDVPAELVPADAFTAVLAEIAEHDAAPAPLPGGGALLLGQYLSALDILTAAEEEELHVGMVRGAVAAGHRTVVFKPHPTAPAHWSRRLEREAEALGAELTVAGASEPAEVLFLRVRPRLVAGCFSTALFTASALYGLPVARVGTGLVLERLSPYPNSNRVPVTIADRLLPDLEDLQATRIWRPPTAEQVARDLTPLVRAVGYCMQPQTYARLRDDAVRYLTDSLDAGTWRYFRRRRLASLALPGAVPSQLAFLPDNPAVRRVARRIKRVASRR